MSEAVGQPAWSALGWKDELGAGGPWVSTGRKQTQTQGRAVCSWDCFPFLQDEEPIRMKAGKDHKDLSSPFLIYSEASPKDSERAGD